MKVKKTIEVTFDTPEDISMLSSIFNIAANSIRSNPEQKSMYEFAEKLDCFISKVFDATN